MQLGTCHPSKSYWANALDLVPKSNNERRPCGDYKALNKITVTDGYRVPHLHYFSVNLHGVEQLTNCLF